MSLRGDCNDGKPETGLVLTGLDWSGLVVLVLDHFRLRVQSLCVFRCFLELSLCIEDEQILLLYSVSSVELLDVVLITSSSRTGSTVHAVGHQPRVRAKNSENSIPRHATNSKHRILLLLYPAKRNKKEAGIDCEPIQAAEQPSSEWAVRQLRAVTNGRIGWSTAPLHFVIQKEGQD